MTAIEATNLFPKNTAPEAEMLKRAGEKYWEIKTIATIISAAHIGIREITIFVWSFQAKHLEEYLKENGYGVSVKKRKNFGKYLKISIVGQPI